MATFLPLPQAIALAKLAEGKGSRDGFAESLAGFYLLKYGTNAPKLQRGASEIRHLRHYTAPRQYKKIAELEKDTIIKEHNFSKSCDHHVMSCDYSVMSCDYSVVAM